MLLELNQSLNELFEAILNLSVSVIASFMCYHTIDHLVQTLKDLPKQLLAILMIFFLLLSSDVTYLFLRGPAEKRLQFSKFKRRLLRKMMPSHFGVAGFML